MKLRLGSMMFLEYFVWGTWYVTVGTWLATTLHFSGREVGWASGSTAVGAMISPFFIGLVADRFFATQRLLAAAHAVGAIVLLMASVQRHFVPLYALLLLYALCFMPTLALTSALAMRHLRDPRSQFGLVRVFGSLGWIAAGLLVGLTHLEATAVPLRLAAAGSLALALYCLTLPDTPPLAREGESAAANAVVGRLGAAAAGHRAAGSTAAGGTSAGGALRQVIPVEVLRLLRERSMAVFVAASFCICIPLQFYYAFTNLFLNQALWPDAAARMTGGQVSETACMLLIPLFFRRLGVKYMLAAGMLAWVLRYLLFAFGDSASLS
ncbi:MAG TPA: MFS transporter, partial [Steroidobacteraceae bacterium]|nr:MFS transporter [Steroidobacteraceae bacterium]